MTSRKGDKSSLVPGMGGKFELNLYYRVQPKRI